MTSDDVSFERVKKALLSALKTGILNFIHAFKTAFGLKMAFNLFLRLIAMLRKRKLPSMLALLVDLQDALRLGLFLGSFSGSFKFVSKGLPEVVPSLKGKEDVTAAIAGGIAGLSVNLDRSRRYILAIYLMPRALQGIYNHVKGIIWPNGKDNTIAGTALFCVASAQVMYSYVMRPDALQKSYHEFIVKSGPIPGFMLGQVRAFNRGNTLDKAAIVKYCEQKGGELMKKKATMALENGEPLLCWALHPHTESCTKQFLDTWWGTFSVRFPLYFSLHAMATALFRRKQLMNKPWEVSSTTLINAVRSDAFLASFCAGYMALVCSHNKISLKDHKMQYWVAGLICSLSVLIEKKQRRDELTLYVLPRGLEALVSVLVDRKLLPKIPNADLLLFCASSAVIMHYYQTKPTMLSSLVVSSLNKLILTRD